MKKRLIAILSVVLFANQASAQELINAIKP